MDKHIDARAAKLELVALSADLDAVAIQKAIEAINHIPAADVAPVVHAHWVGGITMGRDWMKCSHCLHSQTPTGCFVYCPNCGAKMDGEVTP